MKKQAITVKYDVPFSRYMEKHGDIVLPVYNMNRVPKDLMTMRTMCEKFGLNQKAMMVERNTDATFPYPVAIRQGVNNLSYLYREDQIGAWVASKLDKRAARLAKRLADMEEMLEKARKKEAAAARLRYRLKKMKNTYNITITEGDK